MADTSLIEDKIGILIWKTSNYWQGNIRKILNPYNLSLNEYLVLKSIDYLLSNKENIYQKEIVKLIGIDVTVTSVTLKLLEKKEYILRETMHDNRKKNIKFLQKGEKLFNIVNPLVEKEEESIFNKLNNESFNFINSLKLLLGKKIRIKANKNVE